MITNERVLSVSRTTSTAHRLHHYDGACNNVHGHNLTWNVDLLIGMDPHDDARMPVDFKDISEVLDLVDHAIVVNVDDPIADEKSLFGKVFTVNGDPTCENLALLMAQKIYEESSDIRHVELELVETDNYSVTAEYPEM